MTEQPRRYCASCGELKRLTYPSKPGWGGPVACSMRCAAMNWLGLIESGVSAHCNYCGEFDTDCACGGAS
jgi:hypothetical protein